MADDDVERDQESQDDESQQQEQKPPWGSDDEFDPQRAWKLITDLREDVGKFKTERDDLRTKVQGFEDANKTEAQKLADAKDSAAREATEAKAEAARLRVAIKYSLAEDDLEFLGSGTPEEIEERAKKLAERLKRPEDDDDQASRRLPRERLRPGAAPGAKPEKSDPASLAEQVPRGW